MNDTTKVTTYVISVAAELAGMHPQTLRQYDRMGLVTPARTKGRGRRYTSRDIDRLRLIQHLSQEEGVNLAGIKRILDLEERLQQMSDQAEALAAKLDAMRERHNRVFAADEWGQISQLQPGERLKPGEHLRTVEHTYKRPSTNATIGELVPASAWGNERLVSLIAALNALGLRPTWARGPRRLEAPRTSGRPISFEVPRASGGQSTYQASASEPATIDARSWLG